ncbi:hypothetical protein B0H13DRAFT_2393933 [Mycena leptocephala]|nr:hypothetical protein B0H13DRAFT_2393933 [Mycena leptocephala]
MILIPLGSAGVRVAPSSLFLFLVVISFISFPLSYVSLSPPFYPLTSYRRRPSSSPPSPAPIPVTHARHPRRPHARRIAGPCARRAREVDETHTAHAEAGAATNDAGRACVRARGRCAARTQTCIRILLPPRHSSARGGGAPLLRAYAAAELKIFHCARVRRMPLTRLDLSMLIGSPAPSQDEPPTSPGADNDIGLKSVSDADVGFDNWEPSCVVA